MPLLPFICYLLSTLFTFSPTGALSPHGASGRMPRLLTFALAAAHHTSNSHIVEHALASSAACFDRAPTAAALPCSPSSSFLFVGHCACARCASVCRTTHLSIPPVAAPPYSSLISTLCAGYYADAPPADVLHPTYWPRVRYNTSIRLTVEL